MHKFRTIVKHNITLNIYQYVDISLEYLNSEIPSALKPQDKKEHKFSKLIAYLIGHIIKNNRFIMGHLGGGSNEAALFILMTFLADDSVQYSKATEFNPYKSKMPKPKETLEENFFYFNKHNFWIIVEYAQIFYDLKIKPYWGGEYIFQHCKYFVTDTCCLQISKEGREKLKKEWPQIVEELGID